MAVRYENLYKLKRKMNAILLVLKNYLQSTLVSGLGILVNIYLCPFGNMNSIWPFSGQFICTLSGTKKKIYLNKTLYY